MREFQIGIFDQIMANVMSTVTFQKSYLHKVSCICIYFRQYVLLIRFTQSDELGLE